MTTTDNPGQSNQALLIELRYHEGQSAMIRRFLTQRGYPIPGESSPATGTTAAAGGARSTNQQRRQQPAQKSQSGAPPARGRLSEEGKAKIAAAQKKRWENAKAAGR